MNYYEHHIGDYAAATAHLSLVEDAIYSRLLRRYYLQETCLPVDVKQVARLAGARSPEEVEAVKAVLDEFFHLEESGWHNKRADQEIQRYNARVEAARENGKKGGNPKKKAGYNEPGYLYAVQRQSGGPIKVGITKYPAPRMSDLRSKNGPIEVLAMVQVADMGASEARVHQNFAAVLDGEWIAATSEAVVAECLKCSQPIGTEQAQMFAASSQTLQTPDTNTSVANATEASASTVDPIWGTGLAFLRRRGIPEKQARALLGKLRQACGDIETGFLLTQAEADDISDPAPWLMASASKRRTRAGPHSVPAQQPSKTLSAIQKLQAMKHGNVDPERDHGRAEPVALLEPRTYASR